MSDGDMNYKSLSNQIVDMMVGHTLKKHGVKLDGTKLDEEDRKRIREMVESLKKSVDDLTSAEKADKENGKKNGKVEKNEKREEKEDLKSNNEDEK